MTVQDVGAPAVAPKTEVLRALVDRADRAWAQAITNCENLERAMSRTRAFIPGHEAARHAAERTEAEDRLRQLEETVEGLMKRLESQGPIEQAKGIIIAQTHCTPDQAFEILRRASQRSNTKLRLLALDLVARTSRTDAAAS